LSFTEVGEILRLLQAVEGTHVELEWGDLRLQVRRGGAETDGQSLAGHGSDDGVETTTRAAPVEQPTPEARVEEPQPPAPSEVGQGSDVPAHWVAVSAPMAGTFYRSPKPDDPPYVDVGDVVSVGDTMAMVEVMKLFTELKAEAAGKVARVEVEDSQLVEFGQPLLWIEPS
jgi:acetyl-CoA carboxylase biotin carboxyl carrier protein